MCGRLFVTLLCKVTAALPVTLLCAVLGLPVTLRCALTGLLFVTLICAVTAALPVTVPCTVTAADGNFPGCSPWCSVRYLLCAVTVDAVTLSRS